MPADEVKQLLPANPVLVRGNHTTTLSGTTGNYRLSLDINPLGVVEDWGSIVHFTYTGDNCCNFGDRAPALFFWPGTTQLHVAGTAPPVRLHGFNWTTFSPCCLSLGPILLYHCIIYMLLHYTSCTSVTCYRSTCIYMHHPCMTLHTTTCGDQCLIHYRTYQRDISYKVTKLTVPLKWLYYCRCARVNS